MVPRLGVQVGAVGYTYGLTVWDEEVEKWVLVLGINAKRVSCLGTKDRNMSTIQFQFQGVKTTKQAHVVGVTKSKTVFRFGNYKKQN